MAGNVITEKTMS